MIQEPIKEIAPQPGQISPFLQFLTLVGITIGLLIVFGLIAAGIITAIYGVKTLTDTFSFNTSNPHIGPALWALQIISTTIPLFVAPLLFARFITNEPKTYLKANFNFTPVLLVLVFAVMLFSSPLMELLININQKLVLPGPLKGLEDALRNMEQQAQKATNVLLEMKTVWAMLWAVFVIGLLTAIAEEFLFRGALQTIMLRLTKNVHAAVWITAILFSAFHMEFFTFLPRVLLGAFFGYFVAWSGSIWTSVWAHFLNNASQVVIYYLYKNKMTTMDPDNLHVFNYSSYAFSLIIILILLYIYRNVARGKPVFNY